jgi:hypothetical protein
MVGASNCWLGRGLRLWIRDGLACEKLRASGVEPYAHNCDALRSNFLETFSRVTKWWRRSRQGESPDGSDRSHLLPRFSWEWASPRRPVLHARMIVLRHRMLSHRKGATGTTDWIGHLFARRNTCCQAKRRVRKRDNRQYRKVNSRRTRSASTHLVGD